MILIITGIAVGALLGIFVLFRAHRWHPGSRCMSCRRLLASLQYDYFDRCPHCGAGKFETVTLRRRWLFGVEVK